MVHNSDFFEWLGISVPYVKGGSQASKSGGVRGPTQFPITDHITCSSLDITILDLRMADPEIISHCTVSEALAGLCTYSTFTPRFLYLVVSRCIRVYNRPMSMHNHLLASLNINFSAPV